MKKLLSLALITGMTAFYACGPSAEDKAKQEQMEKDSIAMADSMMRAAEEAAKQNAMSDSMNMMSDSTKMMADTTKKM
jgi:hypothetical protein